MKAKPAARRGPRQATRVEPALAAHGAARVDAVDAARGFAIAMMIAYHFCFDLTFYHWADWPMLDAPGWIAWRSAIVASFLFVVGVSLALRDARTSKNPRTAWFDRGFVRRWVQVAAAAALVTAGSVALFPKTFIYFGVLHFVAVAVWLCRRAPRVGGYAIAAGVAAIGIGLGWADAAFDPRALNWIGFAATKPLTEDYVPLFPWLGVVLLGCGAGAMWGRRGFRVAPAIASAAGAIPLRIRRAFVGMGRWSLTIYLVHQPLMLGVLGLVKLAIGTK